MTFLEQLKACEHEPWFGLFLSNIVNTSKHDSTRFALSSIIDSFGWIDSPQGHKYWSDISSLLPSIDNIQRLEAVDIVTSTYPKSQFPEYYI